MATKRRKATRRKRRVSGNPALAPAVVSGTRRKRRNTKFGKVRSHKRRVSKVGAMDSAMQMIAGAAAGVVVGIAVDMFVTPKLPDTIPYKDKIMDALKVGAGAFLAVKMKNKPMALGAGLGLASYGLATGAKNFGVIAGMEQFVSGHGDYRIAMNGNGGIPPAKQILNSTNMIGRSNNEPQPSIISGMESLDQPMQPLDKMPAVISGY